MRFLLFLRSFTLSRSIRGRTDLIGQGIRTASGFALAMSFVIRSLIVVGFGVVILFPFFWMINISVMSYENLIDASVVIAPDPQNNYSNLPNFWNSFGYSAAVTTISVTATVLIILPTSYAFARINFWGKRMLWGLFLAALALPEVAMLTGQYRLTVILDIKSNYTVILALVLPYLASVLSTYLLRNAFENISSNMVEAAMIDGASHFRIFVELMLPAVRGTIWTITILSIIASWNSYTWPALILNDTKVRTLPIWLFLTGLPENQEAQSTLWNVRMAASVLAIVPLMIFYLVFRRRIMSSVATRSGTKG